MKLDLRPWLLDPDRRDCLIRSYRKEKEFNPPACILEEMNAHGLLERFPDLSQGLSRAGELLAYNIEEFRIQIENRKIFSVLEKLNVSLGNVVLDVGCGGGQSLFALADRQPSIAIGIDPERGHLDIAQSFALNFPLKNGRYVFQQGDGNFLPIRDGAVDVLICRGTLHHLNIRQALQEMVRVLKPGGRVFIHALGMGAFTVSALNSSGRARLFALFVLLNGIIHFVTGRQMTIKYKRQLVRAAFLTVKSLSYLEELGVKIKSLEPVPQKSLVGYYVLVGEKS